MRSILIPGTFLVLLAAKVTNHIDWSWWWVTAPLWAGYGAAIAIVTAAVALKAVAK